MPEGAAVVRAEAVIGSEDGGGRLADRWIHLALVEAGDAGKAGGGVVAGSRRAGGAVCGVHCVGGQEEVGLLLLIHDRSRG